MQHIYLWTHWVVKPSEKWSAYRWKDDIPLCNYFSKLAIPALYAKAHRGNREGYRSCRVPSYEFYLSTWCRYCEWSERLFPVLWKSICPLICHAYMFQIIKQKLILDKLSLSEYNMQFLMTSFIKEEKLSKPGMCGHVRTRCRDGDSKNSQLSRASQKNVWLQSVHFYIQSELAEGWKSRDSVVVVFY